MQIPREFNQSKYIVIDLSHNNIELVNLHKETNNELDENRKLFIDLGENPIKCYCSSYPLLRYINDQKNVNENQILHLKTTNLKCHGPQEYAGKLLSDININKLKCNEYQYKYFPKNCFLRCPMMVNEKENSLVVNCENMNFEQLPLDLCLLSGYKIELNLRYNNLRTVSFMLNPNYMNVTKLLLSGNKITKFNEIQSDNIEVINIIQIVIVINIIFNLNKITNCINFQFSF